MVVGLDSASPQFIDQWVDSLPNLRLLREEGVHGVLESIVPPSSVPAWQCFATGKNPAKIGLWGFLSIGPDRRVREGTTTPEIGCIWDLCSKAGMKVGVFNVPGTYPPYPVNGFMVSGFPTPPGKVWAYPENIMKRLDSAVDGYDIDVPLTKPSEMRGGEEAYLDQVQSLHKKSIEAAKLLVNWFDPEVFVMTLQGLDLVQHDFSRYLGMPDSKYSSIVKDWYVNLDSAVGELRALATRDTVFLVLSDHGSIPISTSFHVNEFLQRKGLLHLKPGIEKKEGGEFYSRVRKMVLKHLSANTIRTIYRLTPDRIAHKFTASAYFERILSGLVESIDWENTKAFSTGGPQAAMYFNLKAKDGSDENSRERTELINTIREAVNDLTHPKTGERIRAVYHLREDVFRGPYQNEAPDLAVELFGQNEKIHIRITPNSGELWSFSPHLSSEHIREGFWSMTGPGIHPGLRQDASILDMAPTLQKILGLDLAEDLDGKALQSIFQNGWQGQSERVPGQLVGAPRPTAR
jgi:predicted AlkP superfamily phosphohydrolase/phosphomutase